MSLYADGKLVETQKGETVFTFRLALTGEHRVEAVSEGAGDSITIRRVSEPDQSYIFLKSSGDVKNWFDEEIDPEYYSVNDTLGELHQNPRAGGVIDAMMSKAAEARGDVAAAVKDNPALQRMMACQKLITLLKQGGADKASIQQLNRVLQGIKK